MERFRWQTRSLKTVKKHFSMSGQVAGLAPEVLQDAGIISDLSQSDSIHLRCLVPQTVWSFYREQCSGVLHGNKLLVCTSQDEAGSDGGLRFPLCVKGKNLSFNFASSFCWSPRVSPAAYVVLTSCVCMLFGLIVSIPSSTCHLHHESFLSSPFCYYEFITFNSFTVSFEQSLRRGKKDLCAKSGTLSQKTSAL